MLRALGEVPLLCEESYHRAPDVEAAISIVDLRAVWVRGRRPRAEDASSFGALEAFPFRPFLRRRGALLGDVCGVPW